MATDSTARPSGVADTAGKPGETVKDMTTRAVTGSYGQAQATTNQVTAFIRGQPVAAALIALGLGYILGRLRI